MLFMMLGIKQNYFVWYASYSEVLGREAQIGVECMF